MGLKRWMEQFKPLLDSLLMALESLQQRLASKEDAEGGEETTKFNASFGSRNLQNYKTTPAKIGLDLVCLKKKKTKRTSIQLNIVGYSYIFPIQIINKQLNNCKCLLYVS